MVPLLNVLEVPPLQRNVVGILDQFPGTGSVGGLGLVQSGLSSLRSHPAVNGPFTLKRVGAGFPIRIPALGGLGCSSEVQGDAWRVPARRFGLAIDQPMIASTKPSSGLLSMSSQRRIG